MMQLRLREAQPLRQHSAKVHTAFRIRVGLLTLYMLTAALCVVSFIHDVGYTSLIGTLCNRANLGSLADSGTAFPDIFTASGKTLLPSLEGRAHPRLVVVTVGMAVFLLFATQSVRRSILPVLTTPV